MAKTKYTARSTVSLGKVPYEPVGFEKQAYFLVHAGQEFYAESDAVQKLVRLGLIVPVVAESKPEEIPQAERAVENKPAKYAPVHDKRRGGTKR